MDTTMRNVYFNVALDLVKKAGELVRQCNFQINKTITVKSSQIDLVTATDQQVERLLIDGLSSQFPDHKFIGEESTAATNETDPTSKCNLTPNPTWIIDPIDGTMNFVHGFPHSCISIALFVDHQPEIGIIYNPVLEQLFTAKCGEGTFYNGRKVTVAPTKPLQDALLMMECGTSRSAEKMDVVQKNQQILMNQVHGLRALGSCALDMAMVALGVADAYFEFGIHIWDIAAGELLVREAGGVILDPSGGELDRFSRRVLVASSESLAKEISQKIAQYYPQPTD